MNGLIKVLFDESTTYMRSFLAAFAIDTGSLDAYVKLYLIRQHTDDYLKQVIKRGSSNEDVMGRMITIIAFILLLLLHLGTEPVTPAVKVLGLSGAIEILDPAARVPAFFVCLVLISGIVIYRARELQVELAPYIESNKQIA